MCHDNVFVTFWKKNVFLMVIDLHKRDVTYAVSCLYVNYYSVRMRVSCSETVDVASEASEIDAILHPHEQLTA